MAETLKDRLAGDAPKVDDPIWKHLPDWLESAQPLSDAMQSALTIAYLQKGLDRTRFARLGGLTSFIQNERSFPLVPRLAGDLRKLDLNEAAEMVEELPALFRVGTLADIPGRTRDNREDEGLWDKIGALSKRMAEIDTASALWTYLKAQQSTETISAELPKGFFKRLFGG